MKRHGTPSTKIPLTSLSAAFLLISPKAISSLFLPSTLSFSFFLFPLWNSLLVSLYYLAFDLNSYLFFSVFFRYGEIVDVNLVRDKGTGKSRGFSFLAYEDQRSTILAVG